MKKLLLLLTLAAFAACNTEDEKDMTQKANFAGTLTVKSNNNEAAVVFLLEDVRFELTDGDEGLLNLTMHEIRFAESMPMSLNIVIPKLRYADTDGDGIYELTSTVTPIVPWIGDKPYSAFEIPEFSGTLTDGKLNITFVCRNPKIPVGSETLDHTAVYNGKILL